MKMGFASTFTLLLFTTISVCLGEGGNEIYINNMSDFIEFSSSVSKENTYSSTTVYLNSSLDFYGGSFTPIGSNIDNPFCGTFDGQGYIIYNLTIDSSEKYIGLFGCIKSATIKNVTLDKSCTITPSGTNELYIGGICGYCKENCTINGCINKANINSESKNSHVGGIIGYCEIDGERTCTLINNMNYGNIVYTGTNDEDRIGGIAGVAKKNAYIKNCINFGDLELYLTGTQKFVGGIIGFCGEGGGDCTIENSVNYGTFTYNGTSNEGKELRIGGIAGKTEKHTYIQGCMNFGEINASVSNEKGFIGGLISFCNPDKDSVLANSTNYGCIVLNGASKEIRIGGVVGRIEGDKLNIQNCSNFGTIHSNCTIDKSNGYIGGIVGEGNNNNKITGCISDGVIEDISNKVSIGAISAKGGSISDCYYNENICNVSTNACSNTGSSTPYNETNSSSVLSSLASANMIVNTNGATLTLKVNCEVTATLSSKMIILPSSSTSSQWYTNSECTNIFSLNEITENTTLYQRVGSYSGVCDPPSSSSSSSSSSSPSIIPSSSSSSSLYYSSSSSSSSLLPSSSSSLSSTQYSFTSTSSSLITIVPSSSSIATSSSSSDDKKCVQITFSKKDLTNDEINQIIKSIAGDNSYTISKIEIEDGQLIAIIKFEDVDAATNFVETIKTEGGNEDIKGVSYMSGYIAISFAPPLVMPQILMFSFALFLFLN